MLHGELRVLQGDGLRLPSDSVGAGRRNYVAAPPHVSVAVFLGDVVALRSIVGASRVVLTGDGGSTSCAALWGSAALLALPACAVDDTVKIVVTVVEDDPSSSTSGAAASAACGERDARGRSTAQSEESALVGRGAFATVCIGIAKVPFATLVNAGPVRLRLHPRVTRRTSTSAALPVGPLGSVDISLQCSLVGRRGVVATPSATPAVFVAHAVAAFTETGPGCVNPPCEAVAALSLPAIVGCDLLAAALDCLSWRQKRRTFAFALLGVISVVASVVDAAAFAAFVGATSFAARSCRRVVATLATTNKRDNPKKGQFYHATVTTTTTEDQVSLGLLSSRWPFFNLCLAVSHWARSGDVAASAIALRVLFAHVESTASVPTLNSTAAAVWVGSALVRLACGCNALAFGSLALLFVVLPWFERGSESRVAVLSLVSVRRTSEDENGDVAEEVSGVGSTLTTNRWDASRQIDLTLGEERKRRSRRASPSVQRSRGVLDASAATTESHGTAGRGEDRDTRDGDGARDRRESGVMTETRVPSQNGIREGNDADREAPRRSSHRLDAPATRGTGGSSTVSVVTSVAPYVPGALGSAAARANVETHGVVSNETNGDGSRTALQPPVTGPPLVVTSALTAAGTPAAATAPNGAAPLPLAIHGPSFSVSSMSSMPQSATHAFRAVVSTPATPSGSIVLSSPHPANAHASWASVVSQASGVAGSGRDVSNVSPPQAVGSPGVPQLPARTPHSTLAHSASTGFGAGVVSFASSMNASTSDGQNGADTTSGSGGGSGAFLPHRNQGNSGSHGSQTRHQLIFKQMSARQLHQQASATTSGVFTPTDQPVAAPSPVATLSLPPPTDIGSTVHGETPLVSLVAPFFVDEVSQRNLSHHHRPQLHRRDSPTRVRSGGGTVANGGDGGGGAGGTVGTPSRRPPVVAAASPLIPTTSSGETGFGAIPTTPSAPLLPPSSGAAPLSTTTSGWVALGSPRAGGGPSSASFVSAPSFAAQAGGSGVALRNASMASLSASPVVFNGTGCSGAFALVALDFSSDSEVDRFLRTVSRMYQGAFRANASLAVAFGGGLSCGDALALVRDAASGAVAEVFRNHLLPAVLACSVFISAPATTSPHDVATEDGSGGAAPPTPTGGVTTADFFGGPTAHGYDPATPVASLFSRLRPEWLVESGEGEEYAAARQPGQPHRRIAKLVPLPTTTDDTGAGNSAGLLRAKAFALLTSFWAQARQLAVFRAPCLSPVMPHRVLFIVPLTSPQRTLVWGPAPSLSNASASSCPPPLRAFLDAVWSVKVDSSTESHGVASSSTTGSTPVASTAATPSCSAALVTAELVASVVGNYTHYWQRNLGSSNSAGGHSNTSGQHHPFQSLSSSLMSPSSHALVPSSHTKGGE